MSNINDQAKIDLFVNGEQAKNELARIDKTVNSLREDLKKADAAGDLKAANKLRGEINRLERQAGKLNTRMEGTQRVMSNLEHSSITGLKNALKYLQQQLNATKPDTPAWREYADAIDKVKGRLQELQRQQSGGSGGIFDGLLESAHKVWPAFDMLSRGYNSLVNGMKEYVEEFASMDKEIQGVRKYSGMSQADADRLNEEFKKLDTRTSREELNRLAQDAAKLGKTSVEDIFGFVRAADQLKVALDTLGDDAPMTLSKLTGIFGDEERYGTEQSLLKVGSVINVLSQNCSASAPYLAEFASRMGGVGAQAGMTVQQIMGMASVLDVNNQSLASSATAISQVLTKMMQNPAKFAKAAGLEVNNFARLLKEDANGALILFLETLNKAGGMDTLAPMFKEMGTNGAGAIAALSTLANNIDMVKSQQEEANRVFEEGTSVTNEAAFANSTIAANLDKAKNQAKELRIELGQQLQPIYTGLIVSMNGLTKALMVSLRYLSDHKGAVLSVMAAIAAFTIAVKANTIAEALNTAANKTGAAIKATGTAAANILRLAYYKLTGQTQKATAAQDAMNAVQKATPVGLLISGLTLAAGLLTNHIMKVREAKKAQEELKKQQEEWRKSLTDIGDSWNESAGKERRKLDELYKAATDVTKSMKDRLAAVKELKRQYPDYFGKLSNEIILAGTAKQAYDDLAASITNSAKARAAQRRIDANWDEYIGLEATHTENKKKNDEARARRSELEAQMAAKREQAVNDYMAKATANGQEMSGTTQWEVARLRSGGADYTLDFDLASQISALTGVIRSTAAAGNAVVGRMREINKANQELVDMYGAKNERPKEPVIPDGGFTPAPSDDSASDSPTVTDKKKKAKELKDDPAVKAALDALKHQYDQAQAQNAFDYQTGTKLYTDYLAEKARLDKQYIDDQIAAYDAAFSNESAQEQRLLKMYDDDYSKLLAKRAEMTEKERAEERAQSLASLKKEYEAEALARRESYQQADNALFGDTKAQEEDLFRLKVQYLTKYRDVYEKNSKEWLQYNEQILKEELDHAAALRKSYIEKAEQLTKQYEAKSAEERKQAELEMLEELHHRGLISEEVYLKAKADLNKKYHQEQQAEDAKRYTVEGPGGKTIDVRSTADKANARGEALNAQKSAAIAELDTRLKDGLITQEEYEKGLGDIEKAYRHSVMDPILSGLDEGTRKIAEMGLAFADLFADIADGGSFSLENLTSATAAAFSVMTSALQTYSQFMQAEQKIETAAVERRYNKEIKLAQGNSYKVAAAEKKKEAEIAAVKKKYAQKEFAIKVASAIAQTAQNALMGYAAGLQAPFPMSTWMPALLAGLAAAQGAVQLLLIKKQQQAAEAEGYAEGGFTRKGRVNEVAGVVHAGEWVASQKLVNNPQARPMIDALEHAQRTNTFGLLRSDDVSRSITATNSLARVAETDTGSATLAAVASHMADTVADLTDRLERPFVTVNTVTGDQGIKKAQEDYSKLINNVTPKSRRK